MAGRVPSVLRPGAWRRGRRGPSKDYPPSALASLPPTSSLLFFFLHKICVEHYPVPTVLGAGDPELKRYVCPQVAPSMGRGPLSSLQGWGYTKGCCALEKEGLVCPGHWDDLRKIPLSEQ